MRVEGKQQQQEQQHLRPEHSVALHVHQRAGTQLIPATETSMQKYRRQAGDWDYRMQPRLHMSLFVLYLRASSSQKLHAVANACAAYWFLDMSSGAI
jgi:hypothetical protein